MFPLHVFFELELFVDGIITLITVVAFAKMHVILNARHLSCTILYLTRDVLKKKNVQKKHHNLGLPPNNSDQ